MARSRSPSSTSTDLDPSTSPELEKGRDSIDVEQRQGKREGGSQGGDPEKQSAAGGLRRIATRDSNTQAIPGVRLDESDFEDGGRDHDDEEEGAAAEDDDGRSSRRRGSFAERVISRTTSKSSFNPGPPPDGGLKAWTAVAAGHLVIMNTWGYINSFGVFQTYYANELALGPPATISWIGSIQVFLLFFIGTFTGRITDAGVSYLQFFVHTFGCGLHLHASFVLHELLLWLVILGQGLRVERALETMHSMPILIAYCLLQPSSSDTIVNQSCFLVLSRGLPPRNSLPAPGHLHHGRVHQVLAALPGPGRLHGHRQRVPLLPHGGDGVDVL